MKAGIVAHPLSELPAYIVSEHHVYTRQALETIALLSERVAARHGRNHEEVLMVRGLFGQLAAELEQHMTKEEQTVFPYVEALAAQGGTDVSSSGSFGPVVGPIGVMLLEHESANDKMLQIRRVTRNYTLPPDACLSFRALYERLLALESDLQKHMKLEHEVLFPQALQLEPRLHCK